MVYGKSSFSQAECVEVASLPDGTVFVRDSKDPTKPAHVFDKCEWAAFVAGAKAGEFDFGMEIPSPRPGL
ncbi:DUF397 domain-containing protein [Pseudonocardia acaciae]|uniref:DUF397 domain-containing protein n=1 Tax=Pseudonocardia acaciae TaxID=551276 RepID=UPI00316AE287